jgi:hypothetical protein
MVNTLKTITQFGKRKVAPYINCECFPMHSRNNAYTYIFDYNQMEYSSHDEVYQYWYKKQLEEDTWLQNMVRVWTARDDPVTLRTQFSFPQIQQEQRLGPI